MLMYHITTLQCIRPSASQPCERCRAHNHECTRNMNAREFAQQRLNSEARNPGAATLDTTKITNTLLHQDKLTLQVFTNPMDFHPNLEDESESGSALTENAGASMRQLKPVVRGVSFGGVSFPSFSGISLQHSGGSIFSGPVSMGPEYSDRPTAPLDPVQIKYALSLYLATWKGILDVMLTEVH